MWLRLVTGLDIGGGSVGMGADLEWGRTGGGVVRAMGLGRWEEARLVRMGDDCFGGRIVKLDSLEDSTFFTADP